MPPRAQGWGRDAPAVANQGRILSIIFQIREENANLRQVVEESQAEYDEAERTLLQLYANNAIPDPVVAATTVKQMEVAEVRIKETSDEILHHEKVERDLIQECLTSDLLVVETMESLEWLVDMHNNQNWQGQVYILRPLLPAGQATDIFIDAALLICNQNGMNVEVIQNYGDL